MVDYTIVEAKPWHCGQMSRLLRREHQMALGDCQTHKALRAAFDESGFRRACMVDGRIIALWGLVSPEASAYGVVWLAMANGIEKYPLALIKEVRHQIAEMMLVKRMLICTVLEEDKAAQRFAIFLGFVPKDGEDYAAPAQSRFGRREIARKLDETETLALPNATGRIRVMVYRERA
jgi:hypothetical protein